MIRPTNEVFEPENANAFKSLGALLRVLGRYGKARWNLARLEGKAAFGDLAAAVGLVAAGALAAVLAYLFLCWALVLAVAQAIGGRFTLAWTCAGMAVLQGFIVALALWLGVKKARQPKLQQTFDELRKEQAWVQNLAKS